MNILVINWQDWLNPLAGGAEIYLYEIFSRLVRKNHRVILLCSRAPGQARSQTIDGIDIVRLGRRANFNLLAPFAMRAVLRHSRIDVVIDDLNKIPFFSPAFTRKRVYAMLMHVFRRTIYRETNFLAASYVYYTERMIPWFYARSGFIAISRGSARDLKEIGVRRPINVVHSGIPSLPAGIGGPRERDLAVYVGRVKRYKSIDHFIRAVDLIRKRRPVRAMIVGDGDYLPRLKALARQLAIDIEFKGFVSEEEKFQIYSRARVVVQPSVKEGWGLTAIEAQACGTPVVCADSPGLNEVVADGRTGHLYPYGDIDGMSALIAGLLDDDEKWKSFSAAARTWAGRFSWDAAAGALERLLADDIGPMP